MNIFGSDLTTRDNWNQVGSHANSGANHVKEASGTGGPSDLTSSLQSGQVFQGDILNITSKNVTIRLDNQQILHARLGESVELNIGQRMYFEVKENQGEQIFIRPLKDMDLGGQNLAAQKALDANGFSFTERNFQIAGELMQAGMPLDKEGMRKIMQQSMNYPDASIKNLVSMNQLGIPVNPVNVAQFEAYVGHEHQLTSAIDAVLDEFEAAYGEITDHGSLEQMKDVTGQLIHIFGWENTDSVETNISGESAAISGGAAGEGTNISGEFAVVSEGAAGEGTNVSGESAVVSEGTAGEGTNISGESAVVSEGLNGESAVVSEGTADEGTNISGSVTRESDSVLQSVEHQLMESGVPEEQVHSLMDSAKSYGELIRTITNYFEGQSELAEDTSYDAARKLFQSDSFRKLLRKGIQDEWLMKPEEMKSPKDIDELYRKLMKQSSMLNQSLDTGGSQSQRFSGQAQNMRDNIQFMQQLNQQFVFAQMPMRMNGEEANSELFLYVNKKQVQQNTDGVKVLLHLDMPNLGNTDILVRLKDNMLHAGFTLEDDSSVSVILSHMQELTQKLTEKGFHFTNEVVRREIKTEDDETKKQVPDPVIDEMLNQDLITGVKRYTFDIRG